MSGTFVDSCELEVQGGRGGNGAVSFRREKYIPRGGPDGGDGGDGGNVVIEADDSVDSLEHLRSVHRIRASNGKDGSGSKRRGKRGEDAVIQVPPGTSIIDADSGMVLKTLHSPGDSVVIARGGRGGRGNAHFASAEHQAPRRREEGKEGTRRRIRLVCPMRVDVAIVGPPNSGKSTLMKRLTNARVPTADYPFSSTALHGGKMKISPFADITIADCPPLVEGSTEGAGVGASFLRHIGGAKLILLLVAADDEEWEGKVETVKRELARFSDEFTGKEYWIVINKVDTSPSGVGGEKGDFIRISALTGEGVEELKEKLAQRFSSMYKEIQKEV